MTLTKVILAFLLGGTVAHTAVTATTRDGIKFQMRARLDGSSVDISGGVIMLSSSRIIRSIYDEQFFCAYKISAETTADGEVRVTFSEPDLTAKELEEFAGNRRVIKLENFPPPSVKPIPSRIFVDLMVHPVTGQKLRDFIEITSTKPLGTPSAAPRDFTLNDLEYRLVQPRSKALGISENPFTLVGRAVWLYLPNQGRLVFSAHSRPGFIRAGVIRGHKIQFDWQGTHYEIECGDNVIAGGGVYHLYLSLDSNYRLEVQEPRFGAVASWDRLR